MDDDLFDLLGDDFDSPGEKKEQSKEPQKILKLAGGEFEKFAKSILRSLIADNIPPTPANYEIYFTTMMDSKSATFRRKIKELMDFEAEDESAKRATIELEIKRSYEAVSLIFEYSARMFKEISDIKDLMKKRTKDLALADTKLATKNILEVLNRDIIKAQESFNLYQKEIKTNYENMRQVYEQIEEQSDFDSVYGIHNRRYFEENLAKCVEIKNKFGYFTSLMFFRVGKLPCKEKEKLSVCKNICKIINKKLHHADYLSHLEDDCFVLVMQHKNLQKAEDSCERLLENIYDTNFFIGDQELEIKLDVVIAQVLADIKPQLLIKDALAKLDDCHKDGEPYVILNA